jgi:hypothetical protein
MSAMETKPRRDLLEYTVAIFINDSSYASATYKGSIDNGTTKKSTSKLTTGELRAPEPPSHSAISELSPSCPILAEGKSPSSFTSSSKTAVWQDFSSSLDETLSMRN